ncbi:alpha/beta fold hydrolase [Brachybacterium sp. YJGR34]|uniref:alpha/beta fold hydrolase n=1 Tax=Brachybacterium sp. YJGR34 TaxID=2059911 RepID=UPI000E09E748|nr:alpha/beta hydrolase [Brachybacterium sp. YJGR34]
MRTVEVDDVSLVVDEVGDRGDPAVLHIAGATQSMDWWTPDFCALLAAEGLHVLRYDQRDTGQSTTSPPGRPGYTGSDMASDPLRILDALGLDAVHLVGLSMGGGIAQHLAVHAVSRVLTLTLIESSPAGGDTGALSPPDPCLAAEEEAVPAVEDWGDAAAVLEHRVAAERPYAGSFGVDEERLRSIAATEIARSRSLESAMTNHVLLEDGTAADPSRIVAPTLVLHSATDPLLPLDHGEALVRMIPHAVLLRTDGMGHEAPPPPVWDTVVPALADHMLSRERPPRDRGAR